MPSVPIAVSISDVLEVRGGPLRESEVWALLCQSAAAIQDFFIKSASGRKDDTPFAISPATLTVSRDGQVTLAPGDSTWHGTDFTAPEHCSDSAHALSDTAIEKMFLYTLGKTLQVATEYGLRRNEYVSVSHHLDSLLEAMCEENPAVRIGLRPILEACDLHTRQHPDKAPYAQTISRLYVSVLGSIDQTGRYSSDSSRQSTLTLRSRRRPRHPHHLYHHRHSSMSSQSPSPTRSRSRSRSRSRGTGDSDFNSHPSEEADKEQSERLDTTAITTTTTNNSHSHASPPPSSLTAAAASHTAAAATNQVPGGGPASSQDLNASFASSIEDRASLYRSAPAYQAVTPIPGLLGLRMGSPAYEKYLQLKERQRRLKAAQTGEQQVDPGVMGYGGRMSAPHLMPPPPLGMWRGDMMDYMTDARSMASLMSYSLGNYMPELAALDAQAAPSVTHEEDHERGSLLSSELSFLANEAPQPQFNRPNHSSPEEAKQPSVVASSCLKRQREDDAPQEQQQQKLGVHPHPPEELQVESQEEQLQNMCQFGFRDLTPTPDTMPPREFYGPEFVYRAGRPIIRISLPLQGESVKNPALARRVIIVHLTGQKFEAIVDPCMTGRQLFDAVVTHTALDDFFFFGLTYVCEGEHFFLDADTKLHKMSPEGWREGAKGHMPPVTFTLYLRVKFYPDSLADFRHVSSQHLLYLQLRRDILEERCMADDQKLLSLSGLALHAEFGDYNRRTMGQNYFVPEQYLPARVARRLGMGYVHDRALEAHRDALGLAPSQCEIQFIKMVQSLPEYGIHFYKLMRAKNNSSNLVWVGLTQSSLLIAEQSGPHRAVTRALPWPAIMKISFNKRRFSVQPKIDPAAHAKGKPPKLNFFTNSYRKGRYLLQLSTAQHRFHIRMRTRAAALETLGAPASEGLCESEDLQSASFTPVHYEAAVQGPGEDLEEEEQEKEEEELEQMHFTSAHSMNKSVSPESESVPSPEPEEKLDAPPLKYRSPPPYRPNLDYFMEELVMADPSEGVQDLLATAADSDVRGFSDPEGLVHGPESVMMHNGVASPVADPTSSPQHTEHLSSDTSPHHHHHHLQHHHPPEHSSPQAHLPSVQSSLGRHVFEVTLQKEGDKGIGLTIVGGETTSSLDLGIFVKSVLKDGPAARTGQIQAGDRLIAINGVSLEGVQHHEAVQLIRDSVSAVTLLVSQMKVPATVRRKTNGISEDFDIDDDDAVCHSDEDGDLEPMSYHKPLPHPTNIPHTNGVATSASHLPHHSLGHHVIHPSHDHSDFVDSGHFQRSNDIPSGHLRFLEYSNPDTDSVCTDARNEVLLSEEMLVAAELEPCSYSSGDICRALDAGTESDRETQELEILGDIANMPVDSSDTDSDFESAVKATVEGRVTRSSSNMSSSKDPNTARKAANMSTPDSVIYEVVLEKRHGALGIITADGPVNKEGGSSIYIESLVPGGPADRGGVLRPGDCLLEVNSLSLRGFDCERLFETLQSSPDLCLLKVARTRSLDVLAQNEPPEQASEGLDLPQKPGPAAQPSQSQPAITADSFSEDEAGRETPISPPSAFASGAPTPVRDAPPIPIVPPPPPLSLEDERSNNTQSDVDSDVLDSSRSELERIYVAAEKYLEDDGGDYDFDAAVIAAAAIDAGDDIFLADVEGYRKAKPDDLGGHGDGDRNKGEVSPADTIKNDSPTEVCPTDSVGETAAKNESKKSLVRQQRVVLEATGERFETAGDKDDKNVLRDNQEEFTVELQKSPGGGLGFTVVGGVSTTGGCYVKAVVQNPALSDGRLRPGDRLIQVNGHDMTGLSHFEAVTLLRQTPSKVSIKVQRCSNAHLPFLTPPHKTEKNGPPDISENVIGADSREERHTQKPSRHAEPGERSSESAADQQQRLQDAAEEGLEPQRSVKDLVRCLDTPKAIIRPYEYAARQGSRMDKQAEGQKENSELPQARAEKEPAVPSEETTGVLRIVLEKPHLSDSLGFSLVHRRTDGQSGIFIKTLTPGGIAHTNGQLRVGDRLLQVNGVSLIGCSHTKAVRILKQASGSVVLTISRSSEEQLDRDGQEGSASKSGVTSDLDDETSHHPTPSDSTNSSDDVTDDDINAILDEAMNYLENEDSEENTPTPSSREQKTPTPTPHSRTQSQPRPRPKAKRKASNSPKSSEQGTSEGDSKSLVKCENRGAEKNSREARQEYRGYVRRVSSLEIADDLSEEWLSSLPVVAMGKGLEETSTQLLQLLADAVEQEEPMLEFQTLRQMKATDNSEVAKRPENKVRNRYRNVLPYDFNRVKLQTDSKDGNDYINASHVQLNVKGEEQQLCYIACQGPLATTLGHFWQMVWEAGTNVVTMVTQEVESEKVKCHKYWPQSSDQPLEVSEGKYRVSLLKEQTVEDFDIRHLMLRNTDTNEEREIIHMHFTTWPDHGVPDTACPLLTFLRLMHLFHQSGPFVVHCSAGIGRSGVLMAVDTALARIENGEELDLFDIVSELRRQRYGMIQTQDQYLFCYTACMEALLSMES